MKIFLFVCVAVLFTVANSKTTFGKTLPTIPKPCHKSDPDISTCYLNAFHKLKPFMATGIREFNIPALDPLEESVIRVNEVVNELLSVDAIMQNNKLIGLSQVNIDNLQVDVDKLYFEIDMTFPHLQASTEVKFTVSLANVPISLQGFLTGDFTQCKVNLAMQFKPITIEGVEYLFLDNFKPNITVAHGHGQITAKNRQDKSLADLITKSFNENDRSILEIASPVITNIVGGIFRSRLEQALLQVPVEKYLID